MFFQFPFLHTYIQMSFIDIFFCGALTLFAQCLTCFKQEA